MKAVALGADAIMIGRAALYGLAAAGEAGVSWAIAILEEETRRTMALTGCPSIAEIDSRYIRNVGASNCFNGFQTSAFGIVLAVSYIPAIASTGVPIRGMVGLSISLSPA